MLERTVAPMSQRDLLLAQFRSALLHYLPRVALTLFLTGSLYAGYLFYTSVRSIVAARALPPRAEAPAPVSPIRLPAAPGVASSAAEPPREQPRRCVNILLLGIDERSGQDTPSRSDTMILVSLDPVSNTVAMLSIPRDLWVPLPPGLAYSHEDRINTAHFWGDLRGYPGGGPALAVRTVQYNLGVPVDHYARLDFNGLKRIVDEMGGIDVDVPRTIVDTEYPVTGTEVMTLCIAAGRQHMDGDLALKYARTRHDSSDIDRACRQQQIILAVQTKVLRLGIPLARLPALLGALGSSVKTDMPLDEIYAVARAALKVQAQDIRQGVIDDTMTIPWTTPAGAEVLIPRRDRIAGLVRQLFAAPTPEARPELAQHQP